MTTSWAVASGPSMPGMAAVSGPTSAPASITASRRPTSSTVSLLPRTRSSGGGLSTLPPLETDSTVAPAPIAERSSATLRPFPWTTW